jgi:hypothetical protein
VLRGVVLSTLLLGCGFSTQVPQGESDASGGGNPSVDSGPPVDTVPVMTPTVRRITIGTNKVTGGPHADFPLLVTAPITGAHVMGLDIYFSSDQAGATRLAHEMESYQAGALVAWVKVPSLSAATTFYLHYGNTAITTSQENRTAVWSASFAGVWHMTSLDDALAQNNGQNTGTATAGGKISSARNFNGAGNSISVGSGNTLDNVFAGGGTMEAWFVATNWGGSDLGRIFDKGPSFTVLSMCDANQPASLLFGRTFSAQPANWCTAANTLVLNQWMHVAVTYDEGSSGNVPTFYINGVASPIALTSSPSGTATSEAAANLVIGDRSNTGRAFAGRIDEARLSSISRSAAWITTTYENQRDAATFAVLSPPL